MKTKKRKTKFADPIYVMPLGATGPCYAENVQFVPAEDLVNKPLHYNQGAIEVSDFIIDQKMGFLEGNVVKYVSRYRFKNGLEDLLKAEWYLKKLISTLKEQNGTK